ncbi:MAG: hypothetical protein H6843_08840 [Rhodospirillaceae bacterium]|nr:hypothetical protein [Rhodospirillaceae bacterium]
MNLAAGQEFRAAATPTQELWRKLAYLAAQDNGSVLSGQVGSSNAEAENSRKSQRTAHLTDLAQILEQQRLQTQQIQEINDRLHALDRASVRALHDAERLREELLRSANRTADGLSIFQAADGTIYDEHGNEVAGDQIDWESWNPDAGSWEQFLEAQQSVDSARDFRDRVARCRDQIGDDPSSDALAGTLDELDALEASMPPSVAAVYRLPGSAPEDDRLPAPTRTTSAARDYDPASETGLSLGQPFADAANQVEPHQGAEVAPPLGAPAPDAAPTDPFRPS